MAVAAGKLSPAAPADAAEEPRALAKESCLHDPKGRPPISKAVTILQKVHIVWEVSCCLRPVCDSGQYSWAWLLIAIYFLVLMVHAGGRIAETDFERNIKIYLGVSAWWFARSSSLGRRGDAAAGTTTTTTA